ncbi:MAG: hypothetical protein HZA92_10900 [Verrucomicrobia bacterium]|nr:hypothetical protein [Verrucomicrobiota bacterium]
MHSDTHKEISPVDNGCSCTESGLFSSAIALSVRATITQLLAWTAFFYIVLSLSGAAERQAAVSAGFKHSDEFARLIQSAESFTKDRGEKHPEEAKRVGGEIMMARRMTRAGCAFVLAVMTVWLVSSKQAGQTPHVGKTLL